MVDPAVLAWNVSMHTTPAPFTPGAPGGLDALMVRVPGPSSRCTRATLCPSRLRKSPGPTFISDSFSGSYCNCSGTESISAAPLITTGTWKLEPVFTGPGELSRNFAFPPAPVPAASPAAAGDGEAAGCPAPAGGIASAAGPGTGVVSGGPGGGVGGSPAGAVSGCFTFRLGCGTSVVATPA